MEHFPVWLRIAHYVNFLFLTLLIRSGIQILADHPKLYTNDHCTPGTEWLKFGRKKMQRDGLWTSTDEAVGVSSWIALPGGRRNLGIGRHWHLFTVVFWVLNGLIYTILLCATGYWKRIVPTSWDVFPQAAKTFLIFLKFQLPLPESFHPYDSLQQLTYAFVIFILGPLAILTGAAMSPSITARFGWYTNIFGGRQKARSLHFLILACYLIFIVIHVGLVALTNFPKNMDRIVLGGESGQEGLAVLIGLTGIALVVAIHFILTRWSQNNPRQVQRWTGAVIEKSITNVLKPLKSCQEYSKTDISPYFWVNGKRPVSTEWEHFCQEDFLTWDLEINGLVDQPLHLSIAELKSMPSTTQITKHVCIQGWSSIAQWRGVALEEIIKKAGPKPEVHYLIFRSFQKDENGIAYYCSLSLEEACYPQTILAYEMNGLTLPLEYGAPLRLRAESKLGFKMIKWIKSIELVEDFQAIGDGYGGYREDKQFYGTQAGI